MNKDGRATRGRLCLDIHFPGDEGEETGHFCQSDSGNAPNTLKSEVFLRQIGIFNAVVNCPATILRFLGAPDWLTFGSN